MVTVQVEGASITTFAARSESPASGPSQTDSQNEHSVLSGFSQVPSAQTLNKKA